jgi:hypothetical protein
MLTYWEILTAIQSNVPVNDSYAQLWGKKSQNNYTIVTYTGALPATLTGTKAGYLHRYKIYGNTVQSGTPAPISPIYPSECGELETTGVHAGQYKLSLTSAGQDVDIYLGESQTTRRIKKLVLTGEESWRKRTYGDANYTFEYNPGFVIRNGLCSHYAKFSAQNIDKVNGIYLEATAAIIITDLRYTTTTDFNAFLATQYANGTPVTIWCVLTTEETGTINEPLRKIGNYADTIDSTQTSAQIPTSAGSTTISWAGEGLAPSQVELEYEKKR